MIPQPIIKLRKLTSYSQSLSIVFAISAILLESRNAHTNLQEQEDVFIFASVHASVTKTLGFD